MEGCIVAVNGIALLLGSAGNSFVIHIIWKSPKMRDGETALHLLRAVYGFIILCLCGCHDIVQVLDMKDMTVIECSIFQCMSNVLRVAFSLTLVYLLILRCKAVLTSQRWVNERHLMTFIIVVNFVILVIGTMWTRAEIKHLSDCKLMPSTVYKRFSYIPLSLELCLVLTMLTSFGLSYWKLYQNTKRLTHNGSVNVSMFMRKERKGLLTCLFLTTIFIFSLIPMVILQIWLLTGNDVNFLTYKMCIASVRFSLSFDPYVFFLLTNRYRRIFMKCLRGCYSNPSVVAVNG